MTTSDSGAPTSGGFIDRVRDLIDKVFGWAGRGRRGGTRRPPLGTTEPASRAPRPLPAIATIWPLPARLRPARAGGDASAFLPPRGS